MRAALPNSLWAALPKDVHWWMAMGSLPSDGDCLYGDDICTPDAPCVPCLDNDDPRNLD